MKKRTLIISEDNKKRLSSLIERSRLNARVSMDYLDALTIELANASVVPSAQMPADVVTMNSVVRMRDMDSGEIEEFELVYPAEADLNLGRISVYAPVGTAILGYRLGDVIKWPVPAGFRRLKIEEMVYQPERAAIMPASPASPIAVV